MSMKATRGHRWYISLASPFIPVLMRITKVPHKAKLIKSQNLWNPHNPIFSCLKITCFSKYSETSFPFLNRFFFFFLTHISYWDSQLITPIKNTRRLPVYSGKHLVNLENSLISACQVQGFWVAFSYTKFSKRYYARFLKHIQQHFFF